MVFQSIKPFSASRLTPTENPHLVELLFGKLATAIVVQLLPGLLKAFTKGELQELNELADREVLKSYTKSLEKV